LKHHLPVLQDVGPFRHLDGEGHVLLHQEHAHAFPRHGLEDQKDLLGEPRGKARGRLVYLYALAQGVRDW
jgi:hypothetical protein